MNALLSYNCNLTDSRGEPVAIALLHEHIISLLSEFSSL